MDLCEIKIEVAPGHADAVEGVLLELGIASWTLLEDALARRVWLVGIFPSADEARERWTELSRLLPGSPMAGPVMRLLADRDWRDSYKSHFKAWRFGRLHWVPEWERETFALPAGDEVLWLDPGMAFGTGNHETTRLCVERLAELDAQRVAGGKGQAQWRVIDAGCGSGILALSAAKLGFSKVMGFDNDPEAVAVSLANARLNNLSGLVQFYVGDLVTGLDGRVAEVVLANILGDVLIRFARELLAAVAPNGTLVLSGILANECAQVRAVFATAAPGWAAESRTLGEWSDVVLTRLS